MAALALESSSYSPSDTHNVEGSGSEDGDGKGARSVSEAVHRARCAWAETLQLGVFDVKREGRGCVVVAVDDG
eukprot:3263746-Rhodomonas_salina.1